MEITSCFFSDIKSRILKSWNHWFLTNRNGQAEKTPDTERCRMFLRLAGSCWSELQQSTRSVPKGLWWSSSKSSRLTLGCFFNYIMIYLWNPMIVESLIIYIYVYIMAIYIYIYTQNYTNYWWNLPYVIWDSINIGIMGITPHEKMTRHSSGLWKTFTDRKESKRTCSCLATAEDMVNIESVQLCQALKSHV